MLKLLVAVFVVIVSTISASANAFHLNPDQGASSSMATFGPTTIPIGYYEYCQRYAKRCERTAQGSSVKLTPNRWRQIVGVNSSVNTSVVPKTDPEIFGVEERWVYPDGVGDCEDYALLKRKILNEQAGIPLGALSMTVGRDANGGGHAVLTVITDMGDFILDNVEPRVLPWQEAEIRFLKRQSSTDPNLWVSLVRESRVRDAGSNASNQANSIAATNLRK
ncbi:MULTISPECIES: transglutaminase-like cysteine peptidase [Hyphomicrobiales]|jgi:predicted transglutaminase-like cysteine proteinase|uniref:transglutaminase-like cysteine peptidase n=1 Tax=Hyphomicrobiales TaxID=356 RepID=UPI001CBD5967|nr:transglutaminase-like cysteine peptidase [Oricola indica]